MTDLPRICLSMPAAEAEAGLPALAVPFLLELRLDVHPAGAGQLARLVALSRWTLATCRPGTRSDAECGEVLLRALAAGATLVDVDRSTPPGVLKAVRDEAKRLGRGLVVSHHDFGGTPTGPALRGLVDDCFAKGADVAKLACLAATPDDNRRVLALYDGEARPLVAFCMGEVGRPSRMQALARGAPFMYGSAGPGCETAPGQLEVLEMARILAYGGSVRDGGEAR